MILERWSIRHKPSGNFLPLTLRNHTEAEPQPDCVPRLFDSKQSARSALSRWLEGVWRYNTYAGDYYSDWDYDWGPEKPENPRIKSEMEVVKLRIDIQVVSE
jgi:hypothetical protein